MQGEHACMLQILTTSLNYTPVTSPSRFVHALTMLNSGWKCTNIAMMPCCQLRLEIGFHRGDASTCRLSGNTHMPWYLYMQNRFFLDWAITYRINELRKYFRRVVQHFFNDWVCGSGKVYILCKLSNYIAQAYSKHPHMLHSIMFFCIIHMCIKMQHPRLMNTTL